MRIATEKLVFEIGTFFNFNPHAYASYNVHLITVIITDIISIHTLMRVTTMLVTKQGLLQSISIHTLMRVTTAKIYKS